MRKLLIKSPRSVENKKKLDFCSPSPSPSLRSLPPSLDQFIFNTDAF